MLKPVLNKATNFSLSELKKLKEVLPVLEKAINSNEFKKWCVEYDFENAYDNRMNGNQIYIKLMTGAEVLDPKEDKEMDIDLTIYTVPWYGRGKNVIGYTYPSTMRTWVNRKFFSSYTIAGIAGNLAHEWCHKIGFDHSFYWTSTRSTSVPYAVGYKVEELCERILKGETVL
jgi:hypothetical protein